MMNKNCNIIRIKNTNQPKILVFCRILQLKFDILGELLSSQASQLNIQKRLATEEEELT